MARSDDGDGDGRSVLASCGEIAACRVLAGTCVFVSYTTVLVREAQKLAALSPALIRRCEEYKPTKLVLARQDPGRVRA
jgi:hypothetical protein